MTMMINNRNRRVVRIISLIVLVFVMRVFYSCRCPENILYYDFSYIKLSNLDASGMYINQYADSDTMYSAAVGIKVELLGPDTLYRYSYHPSFPLTIAMEECLPSYIPNQQIRSIEIISLLDLSPNYPANSNLSSIFLGSIRDHSTTDFLYLSMDTLLTRLNMSTSYGEQVQSFYLICKENIENDSAAFRIIISLSDGRKLEEDSEIIHIIPSI